MKRISVLHAGRDHARPWKTSTPDPRNGARGATCGLAARTGVGIPAPVSLNRCEEALLRYVSDRTDEKRFWTARVLDWDRRGGALEERVAGLDRELREYAAERGRADASLVDTLGGGRVSMRNLAEHLLALWTPPRPQATRRRAG